MKINFFCINAHVKCTKTVWNGLVFRVYIYRKHNSMYILIWQYVLRINRSLVITISVNLYNRSNYNFNISWTAATIFCELIPYFSNNADGGPERGTSDTANFLTTTFFSIANAERTASPRPPSA